MRRLHGNRGVEQIQDLSRRPSPRVAATASQRTAGRPSGAPGVLVVGVAPRASSAAGEDRVRRARRDQRPATAAATGSTAHTRFCWGTGRRGAVRSAHTAVGGGVAKQRLDDGLGGAGMRLDVISRAEHGHLLAIRLRSARDRGRRWPGHRPACAAGRPCRRRSTPRSAGPSPAPPVAGSPRSPPPRRPGCASSSPGWPRTASGPGCAPARRRPGRRDSPPPAPDSSPAADTSTDLPAVPAAHPAAPPRSAGLPACRRPPVPG